ncbi:MAG: nuclear transport factor 2 family protein [Candidatus Thorarchaeota archaeon]
MAYDVTDSELEVLRLEDNLLEAMRLRKLSFLENIFSEKYVFLGSDGSTWGKDKALNDYKHPNFELSKIEVHNRQITMHDNTAIVTGISIVEGIAGEKSITGRYLFMRVWNKDINGWKIIAVTTSNAEQFNPIKC